MLINPTTNPIPPSTSSKHVTKRNNMRHESLLANIFNKFDNLICSFLDKPLRPSIDPKHVLSGHCAPVDELPPTICDVVEGSLPSSLDGAYIRNGPNPQFVPKGRPLHFFEGDGMLHMIKISRGKVTYCSRYVKTHKHMSEREAGYPFAIGVFSSFNGLPAAMARLLLIGARILSVWPCLVAVSLRSAMTDIPYQLKVTRNGDIITLGRNHLHTNNNNNKNKDDQPFLRMTAHPKVDHLTGEAFAYEYDIIRPFLTYFRINSNGRKQKGVPISDVDGCTVMHDFCVTENYAIFPDGQIMVKPVWVLSGKPPVGVDFSKVPRLGIIPRYAEDDREMWWVDVPGLNMMHCINGWEEEGEIVLVGSNGLVVDQFLENFRYAELRLEKITINLDKRTVHRQMYVYAAVTNHTSWVGVVKLDLELANVDGGDCTVASRLYGPGCNGGEPFFVPREPNNREADEDDGYLVTYVYDENTQISKFLVMDAKSPALDIIAAVKLPQRVPDGFHGLFVSESDLTKL
ncbi:hypothetical protein DH2020_013630 [Rehmannia glutinosa]|uniref:Carotenoid cleavage dioxygenase n=1 Tax=Rehmannia glutinosa TaxID=99300 RepID=A0ABR0X5D2_REHGL